MILENTLIIILNAFITGIFTKWADAGVDNFEMSERKKLLFGFLWGLFASFVVLGSPLLGAFYLGILFSWIFRYKLDHYNHGLGGVMVLATIFYVHPIGKLANSILIVTFILFTIFGLLSREAKMKRILGIIQEYNLYSFLFLGILSLYFSQVWLVFFSSLSNVTGYHGVKMIIKKYT